LFKADFADKFDTSNQNFEIVEEIEMNPYKKGSKLMQK
jgi:hypothetical protein